jgi:pimeloyl-ACP methyl ester carboxylesterase
VKRSAIWVWLWSLEFRHWFARAVRAAQEAYDRCQPEVVVGSSMGGAVAMNLRSGGTPQVLVAPAWRVKGLFRFGGAVRVKPATVIIHGDRDSLVALEDSRRLLRDSPGVLGPALRLGAARDCRTEGRLVVVQGEGHRCNGESALLALLAAVDVLAGHGK